MGSTLQPNTEKKSREGARPVVNMGDTAKSSQFKQAAAFDEPSKDQPQKKEVARKNITAEKPSDISLKTSKRAMDRKVRINHT